MAVGSRTDVAVNFLGRRLATTYEVIELDAAQPGPAPGFSRLVAPVVSAAVRRAYRAGLAHLRTLLEQR